MPIVYKIRETDVIDNDAELGQAILNNLAYFFESLPFKMQYEVKIVSSITYPDGTTLRGTSVKIKTGTYTNGQPKYKMVYNQFAVLDVFAIFEGQTRKKLARVLLAPTNASAYTKKSSDFYAFNSTIPQLVKQNITPVQTPTTTPTTPTPTTIPTTPTQTTTQTQSTPTTPQTTTQTIIKEVIPSKDIPPLKELQNLPDTGWRFYRFSVNGEDYYEVLPWAGNVPFGYTMITQQEFMAGMNDQIAKDPKRWVPFFDQQKDKIQKAIAGSPSGYVIKNGIPYLVASIKETITVPISSTTGATTGTKGEDAKTLTEWYASQGMALPSIAERGKTWEKWGYGSASTYIGSAEQNNSLLVALKIKGL